MSGTGEPLRLYCIRHGNTFAPGAPVLRVGRNEDLPLVERGIEQAHACAAALARLGERPRIVYAGPLLRTRRCGDIIVADLGLAAGPVIDERLTEIDYGVWGGLTDEEIVRRFGPERLAAWNERGEWPPDGVWGDTEAGVRARVRGFAGEAVRGGAAGQSVVIVSSNGTLRFFLELAAGSTLAEGDRKMKTGHMGRLDWDGRSFSVQFWNAGPQTL